jgi:hypothetical protein
MAWTVPRTWRTGELVTSGLLNQQIRDNFNAIAVSVPGAAWTNFTPTWTSLGGTAPAIGNGNITARWHQIAKTVEVQYRYVAGSTTTYGTGTQWRWTLPVTAAHTQAVVAVAEYQDASPANWYMGLLRSVDTSTIQVIARTNAAALGAAWAGDSVNQVPVLSAVSDVLMTAQFYYQAA